MPFFKISNIFVSYHFIPFEEKPAWHSSGVCSFDAVVVFPRVRVTFCEQSTRNKLKGKGGNVHAWRACEGPFRSTASVVNKWVIVLCCSVGSRCSRGALSEILENSIRCYDLCHLRVGVMTELHCARVLWIIYFCGYFLCGLFSRLS